MTKGRKKAGVSSIIGCPVNASCVAYPTTASIAKRALNISIAFQKTVIIQRKVTVTTIYFAQ